MILATRSKFCVTDDSQNVLVKRLQRVFFRDLGVELTLEGK